MFIVKKQKHNKKYFYLRESKRDKGKVKTKDIAYLGKSLKEAKKKAKEIENVRNKIGKEIIKEPKTTKISIDELANFCKRRGFIYPSGEIYGGLAGFWDFGHIGVELKNNIKREWWKYHVQEREDIVGIDGSIITNPKVWEASGHVESFNDVYVKCKKCKKANKIDKSDVDKARCECGGEYEVIGDLNLMFKTNVGPVEGNVAFLRPETAQLIFINFRLVQENARLKLPFGIAQIGKAFRNEISPRDFLFRCREFEQMEVEYFADPNEECPYEIGDSEILIYSESMQVKNEAPVKMKFKEAFKKDILKNKWHAYWLEQEFLWFKNLGANPKKFRIRQHISNEKSHYALDTWDLEYEFPFGWKELQGMANRTDFDLRQHQKYSKTNMEIMNKYDKKILPHVICEPSQGVERALLVFLFDSYEYDKERKNIVLHLHPKLAPVKVGVFPLVNKPEFIKLARQIHDDLKKEFNVVYDAGGTVGRRYARNDETGTPFCITVDGDTEINKDVTVRLRDTTEQVRVKIKNLNGVIRKGLEGENILKLGKKVSTRIKN